MFWFFFSSLSFVSLASKDCGPSSGIYQALASGKRVESVGEKIKLSFSTLTPENKNKLENLYSKTVEFFYVSPPGTNNSFTNRKSVVEGIRASILNEPNGAYAVGLKRLGFRIEGSKITPPESLEQLILNHAKIIEEWEKAGLLKPEEALYISIPVIDLDTKKVVFVIPGKTPWPTRFEVPEKPIQFGHLEFYKPVAENGYPLALGSFFAHDMAHITSKGDAPEIMRETVKYAKKLIEKAKVREEQGIPEDDTFNRWPSKPGRKSEGRSFIVEEWLVLPDVSDAGKRAKLENLVAHLPNEGELTLDRVKKEVSKIKELEAHLKRFFSSRPEKLLTSSGGGARDGFSTLQSSLVQYGAFSRLKYICSRIKEPSKEYPVDFTHSQVVSREMLYNQIQELGTLYQLRYNFDKFFPSLKEFEGKEGVDFSHLRSLPVDQRNKILDSLLVDGLSRIELAFLKALKTGISVRQFYKDARVEPPPIGSPTFNYLKDIYPQGTFHYSVFELDRK